ncbi:MAG: hypothetical protein IJX63_12415 [Lachnospiraceae bacterium]|nr:hypothetical protein [Lachnospiraceae bacterium]
MKNTVYSYHMFLYPFTWSTNDNNIQTSKDFANIFETVSSENIWERAQLHTSQNSTNISLITPESKVFYNTYQFFNEAGKNIIFDTAQNDIVFNFKVKDSFLSPRESKYIISLRTSELTLDIVDINLKVFNTGIAIFFINCENRQHRSLEEVKQINEYGRRVSLSFWPNSINDYKKCADKLSIQKGETLLFCDDFCNFIKSDSKKEQAVSLSYISTIIRNLLNQTGSGKTFRSKQTKDKNDILISPVLDGKMYVSCCIADKTLSTNLIQSFDTTDNSFDIKQARDIAELLCVDLEGKCSYKNEKALKSFLTENLYLTEFGSSGSKLLGITEQSCIKIIEPQTNTSGELLNQYEIDYHNNIYNQILIIGLAQRMAIVNFQQELARIFQGIELNKKRLSTKQIIRIMRLQEKFVTFQSQFLLYEVTAQREGTYIYNRIREVLHIPTESNTLSNQLNAVHQLANLNQSFGFSRGGLTLSLIAMVFSIAGAINVANSLGTITLNNYNGYLILGIEATICLCILVYILILKFKK